MARVHYSDGEIAGATRALCGWFNVAVDETQDAVTCRRCQRLLRKAEKSRPPPEPAFVPSGPYKPRSGCREALLLDRDQPRAPWLSEAHALRELVDAEDEGYRQKSVSDPSRFEPKGMGGSPYPSGDLAQRQVERLHAVWVARARAYPKPWEVQHTPPIEVPVDVCRLILEWRTVGRRVTRRIAGRKSTHADRLDYPAQEVAAHVSGLLRERITAGVVDRIARAGRVAMRHHLRERGLLPVFVQRQAQQRAEGDMVEAEAEYPWDYEGWGEIAGFLGRSVSTVQRWASRQFDPLPVKDALGKVVATKADLESWLRRQVQCRSDAG